MQMMEQASKGGLKSFEEFWPSPDQKEGAGILELVKAGSKDKLPNPPPAIISKNKKQEQRTTHQRRKRTL